MEKTMSQEERIKRARDLYYNRREELLKNQRTTTVNVNSRKSNKLLRKMIIQICVCSGIYLVIYSLIGNNDNFSVDSIKYLKETMGYDMKLEQLMSNLQVDLKPFFSNIVKTDTNENEQKLEDTLGVSDEQNIEEQSAEEQQTEQNIEETDNQIIVNEDASSISQMEQDAEFIKQNISMIKPITGTVTSRFGLRNPTTQTVPKYHTGIDIAVNEGTVYVAAMEGTVELVSSQGDYRESCKNNQWRSNDIICTL